MTTDLGKELHNPIMIMIWGYEGRFIGKEIEIPKWKCAESLEGGV